jgi:conjugative relaxase-like TrwC/TraI family protein
MVTAKTQYNLKNAEEYFKEHLCVGDYYDEGQRVSGKWIGLGAERLGLSGKVHAEDFLRLCENQHPATGERLTPELKTTRIKDGRTVADRRIFYDFTFSPPKSVSLAGFLDDAERIFKAHDQAARLALRNFEDFAAIPARRIRNSTTSNAMPSNPCYVRQMAFLSFGAVLARAKVLSCANWWSNCGSQAGVWSFSRRNVSKL